MFQPPGLSHPPVASHHSSIILQEQDSSIDSTSRVLQYTSVAQAKRMKANAREQRGGRKPWSGEIQIRGSETREAAKCRGRRVPVAQSRVASSPRIDQHRHSLHHATLATLATLSSSPLAFPGHSRTTSSRPASS